MGTDRPPRWQRARLDRGGRPEGQINPDLRPLFGMLLWVRAEPPKAPPGDVVDNEETLEKLTLEKERLFYWTHLLLLHPDGERTQVIMPWAFIELVGRDLNDFRFDDVPFEDWDTYCRAYLREKERR